MKKLLSILSNLSLLFFAFLFFFAPSRALALSQLSIVPGTNSATIYWYTPNAETSLINYGTSPKGLYLSASNLTPVRFHSLTLLNLSPGTTYFFHIFEQKNDNQERYSSFTTTGAAKVTGSQNQQTTSLRRTLKQGMSGSDVRTLQALLNKDSRTRVAATGPGSPGNETMLFGPATTAAVVRFQELYRSQILTPNGLSKGTGVVASATLKQFVVLFGSGAVATNPSASTPNTPYQPTYGVGGNPTTPYTPPVYPAYNPQPNPGSPTYTITASADPGGSISPAGTVSVAYGSSISFTILAKSGYQPSALIIDGVSLSATGVYTFPSVAANHSIRAVFSTAAITPAPNPGPSPSPTPSPTPAPVAYVITASAGAGGSISPAGSVSVTSGTSKTFTLTPSSGYKIATLLIDGVSLSPAGSYTFSNVTASHTISATFALIAATPPAAPTSYTITASAGAGGSISPSGAISVASGASKTFILTPNSGYQLGSLLVDGVAPGSGAALSGFVAPASLDAPTSYTFSNVTANHTISATFTQIVSQTYVISASAGAGGTITPSGSVSVVSGGSQTFTITPNSGYQVLNVLADGVSDMPSHPTGVPITYAIPYTFNSVVANHTLAVTFTPVVIVPVSYTITSTAGANGSISPAGAVSVVSGTSKMFTITPNSGYKIGLLVIDGVSVPAVSSYTFSNVLANHTISATFDLIPPTTYTITASAGTGGSISPSGIVSVTSGSSATFTATPSLGYQFGSLYIDGVLVSGGSSYTFSNVTANHTISVTFNVIVVTPPATPPSAKFVIGDRVQVSSGPLNVRAAAGGTLLGTQATGALGTIGSGPTATTGGNTTVITTWWGINFDTGVDGWSADDFLVKYVAPTPPSTPPAQPPASPTPPPVVSYTITASAGANGTISPAGAVTVASGASQSFTITPNSGYQIGTILVDGASVASAASYTFTNVTANRTISVMFNAIVVTPPATPPSAKFVIGDRVQVSSGPLNVRATAGGTLLGTQATGALGTIGSGPTAITGGNTTAITNWWSINFDAGVDGWSVEDYLVKYVAPTPPPTPPAQPPVSYTITASAGANGSISPSGAVSVVSGTSKSFTITPNSGYQIASLLIDGTAVTTAASYTFSNVTANRTISATFSQIVAAPTVYTVIASAGAGGTISPSGAVAVTAGTSKTFTITPNSGYQISALLVDGVAVTTAGTYTFSNITANRTISATFSQIAGGTYTITALTVGGGGTITPAGAISVAAGGAQTFTATPISGYQISGMFIDGQAVPIVSPYTFSNVTANRKIGFSFSPVGTYSINASSNLGGYVSPNGVIAVSPGKLQSFNVVPNAGNQIISLFVDGIDTMTTDSHIGASGGQYTFWNVTANHSFAVVFGSIVDGTTITASAGPGGSISPSGYVQVAAGTSQQFQINSYPSYQIASITVDGSSVPVTNISSQTYTFLNVRAPHTISATFAPLGAAAQFDFDGNLTNTGGPDVAVMHGGSPVFAAINGTAQKALVLDGVDDYVSVPSSAVLNVGTGNFTVSAWINPAKLKGGIHWRVIDKIGSAGFTVDVVDMGGDQQAHIHFGAIDTSANKVDFYVAGDFLVNEWAMLSIVVNRSRQTVEFYQNATLIATENIPTLTGSLDNSEPLGIGLIPSLEGAAAYHKGMLAKVRLNKSALTAAEIKTRFTAEDPIFQSFTDIVHTGSSPYNDFMRANARTVFGFKNMFYVNSDNYHANFRADQISSDFGFYNLGYGISVHAAVPNKATISNSSTAGGGLAGSNVGQLCLGTGYNGYEYVYGQAVKANSPWQGVYPVVRDGGETNNTVYLPCVSKVAIPTTGHSSGEIKTGTTFARVAAAMPASVGQYLLQRGTIWSAVAAINEWSRNSKSSAALLGKNSTTYVLGSDETESRLMDMVDIVKGMTIATTPPEARFTVTKEPSEALIKGVNTYDDNTEVMFKTPQSAAFTARNLFTKTRVYEVDASASVAPTGATIAEYKWVLTWGDSSKVRITSLNQSGSQARIEIDWHGAEEVPSRYGAGIKSNMYIISLFVKSSTGVYSDSAVLTEYSMPNERRVYDASGKLTEVYFDWNVEGPGTGSGYSETSKFMVRKDFKNLYKYDAGGNLIGWTTKYLDDRFVGDFDARGYKVTYKPDGVTIDTYQVPTYTVDSSGYLQTTYGPTQTAYSGPVGNFINQLASALFSLFGW